jgi:arginine dihydrolase
MSELARYLMCKPTHFNVSYVINPWMAKSVNRVSIERSEQQWNQLHAVIAKHARIELISPQPGLPDMVFTANAGLVFNGKAVLSRFRYAERTGEEKHFEDWFEERRYRVYKLPADLPFEGAGDALLDRTRELCWAGYGLRSAVESHPHISKWLELQVISLRLIDERFYHLDTCFCPLNDGYLLYNPRAFDQESCHQIALHFPESKRIVVTQQDALKFACNAVNIGNQVFLNEAGSELTKQFVKAGFKIVEIGLSEFIKAGGAAKCLTLRLDETYPASPSHP